jgi:hypothetical protein
VITRSSCYCGQGYLHKGSSYLCWAHSFCCGESFLLWVQAIHCWDSSSVVWEASHFSRDEIYFGGPSSCVVVHKKEHRDSFYQPQLISLSMRGCFLYVGRSMLDY